MCISTQFRAESVALLPIHRKQMTSTQNKSSYVSKFDAIKILLRKIIFSLILCLYKVMQVFITDSTHTSRIKNECTSTKARHLNSTDVVMRQEKASWELFIDIIWLS